jgi:hypothetical protein
MEASRFFETYTYILVLVIIRAFNFWLILTSADSVAVRSKAWVCGRSLAGISDSNSAEDISVVCCQAFVSATGRSLVQRSPTECAVSMCDREVPTMRIPWPCKGFCAIEKENLWPSHTQAVRFRNVGKHPTKQYISEHLNSQQNHCEYLNILALTIKYGTSFWKISVPF